ncbi:hypothetical protein HPB52_021020 [Rhipicephalus sanguineus]|uniref:Uncharacterized protein n=1 Tax=Rhipicephalus sanguineus TaxID=34632 RepID=A0A9D4QFK9_RHISA|nr:hypothetical protein HPB52_021020 [Rhipicephalus sanguineus]
MEPDQSGGVTDVEMSAEMTGHRRAFGRFEGSIDSGAEMSAIRNSVLPGHQRIGKNLKLTGAFVPGDVKRYYQSCHQCQAQSVPTYDDLSVPCPRRWNFSRFSRSRTRLSLTVPCSVVPASRRMVEIEVGRRCGPQYRRHEGDVPGVRAGRRNYPPPSATLYASVPAPARGHHTARGSGDPALHAQWQRAVPRAEKKLEENCAVCELHFNDRFISRYFEPTVNEPGLCCFREQFPTQFPNLPAYYPKRLLCSDERLSPSVGKNSSCTGAGGRTASQRAPRNQDRPTPVCRW